MVLVIYLFFLLDHNECLEAALSGVMLCNNNTMCVNTFGSYICECPVGTEFSFSDNRCKVRGKADSVRFLTEFWSKTILLSYVD